MNLFKKKRSATVTEYSHWFHGWDSSAEAAITIDDLKRAYFTALCGTVAEKDPRFSATEMELFGAEWSALRSEVFSLAWTHAFHRKDKYLLGEAAVAKATLTAAGLWDASGRYNYAVAQSTDDALPAGRRARQAIAAGQNSIRVDVATGWVKEGFDKDCVARVVNRLFTEIAWNQGFVLQRLVGVLLQQLGHVGVDGEVRLNSEAMLMLQRAMLEIYDGTRTGLKGVNIRAQ